MRVRRGFGLAAMVLGLVATAPAVRAAGEVMLADFESSGCAAAWSGVGCEVTSACVSGGGSALRTTFAGGGGHQAARLSRRDGAGFAPRDWSAFDDLLFEGCLDSTRTQILTLCVSNPAGRVIARMPVGFLAGKSNDIIVHLDDLHSGLDRRDIDEIALAHDDPTETFTLTIDSLRLVPRRPPPPVEVNLAYPNYRGLVFPGEGAVEVDLRLNAAAGVTTASRLRAHATLESGAFRRTATRTLRSPTERLTLDTRAMPAGDATLSVTVTDPAATAPLAAREWALRRLTPAEARTMPAHIDRHNNLVLDGKPFFPVGWFGAPDHQHLAEIADSPFNCLLDYGTNLKDRAWMTQYLDAVASAGLRLVYCLNDVYPTATYFEGKAWEGVRGNDAIADAVVRAYRGHPAVIAWYLNDELSPKLVPQLTGYYARVRDADPGHPSLIVLCDASQVRHFPDTTDIMGFDHYPIPGGGPADILNLLDRASAASHGTKPVWAVLQAFGWYQYRPTGTDASRGRIPTALDLRTGRAPTRDEARCMTYISLVRGAKGLLYYCYYDMRVLPQYAEMWGWMKEIAAEVRTLSPVLLSPDDLGPARTAPADSPVLTRLKRQDGKCYLLAVNTAPTSCTATFELPRRLPAQVAAMFENRRIPGRGTHLEAQFAPYEARVFTWGDKRGGAR